MKGISRLIGVAVLAVVAFGFALHSFKQVPISQCQVHAVADASYTAAFEEPPTVDTNLYHLRVTHDGRPVEGAQVCVRADMGGAGKMSGMGTSNQAREVAPGRYEVSIIFPMGGPWRATVIVVRSAGSAVAIPIQLQVK